MTESEVQRLLDEAAKQWVRRSFLAHRAAVSARLLKGAGR